LRSRLKLVTTFYNTLQLLLHFPGCLLWSEFGNVAGVSVVVELPDGRLALPLEPEIARGAFLQAGDEVSTVVIAGIIETTKVNPYKDMSLEELCAGLEFARRDWQKK